MPKADTTITIPIIRAPSAADALDNLLCLHKAAFLIWKDRGRGQASPNMDEEEASGLMMIADAITVGIRMAAKATHAAETTANRFAEMVALTDDAVREGMAAIRASREYPRLDATADGRALPGAPDAADGNAA